MKYDVIVIGGGQSGLAMGYYLRRTNLSFVILDAEQHVGGTREGRVITQETKASDIAGLWMVGFGNWTGFASAMLIGVGRSAKVTVDRIQVYLSDKVDL